MNAFLHWTQAEHLPCAWNDGRDFKMSKTEFLFTSYQVCFMNRLKFLLTRSCLPTEEEIRAEKILDKSPAFSAFPSFLSCSVWKLVKWSRHLLLCCLVHSEFCYENVCCSGAVSVFHPALSFLPPFDLHFAK